MSRPQLLPQIGTGLGSRKKATTELGFRDNVQKSGETLAKNVQKPDKPKVSTVFKLRKNIMKDLEKGNVSQEDMMLSIKNSGIQDPLAIETILSTELNDNVIKYFLGATKNNPKKAKSLAKKFGFEV